MILLVFLASASCITQAQQQVIDDLHPVISRCFSHEHCAEECSNNTFSCISSVQSLCSRECDNSPDVINCHRLCEEEELSICGLNDLDCHDICLYSHSKRCQKKLFQCQNASIDDCQKKCSDGSCDPATCTKQQFLNCSHKYEQCLQQSNYFSQRDKACSFQCKVLLDGCETKAMDYCHEECTARVTAKYHQENPNKPANSTSPDTQDPENPSDPAGEIEACERRCMSVQINECLVPYTECMGLCPLHPHNTSELDRSDDETVFEEEDVIQEQDSPAEGGPVSERTVRMLVSQMVWRTAQSPQHSSYSSSPLLLDEKEVSDDVCVDALHRCVDAASTSCLATCVSPSQASPQKNSRAPMQLRSERGCYGRCMIDSINSCAEELDTCFTKHPDSRDSVQKAVIRFRGSNHSVVSNETQPLKTESQKNQQRESEQSLASENPTLSPELKDCFDECSRDRKDCFRMMENFCTEECNRREAEYQQHHSASGTNETEEKSGGSESRKEACMLACDDHNSATCVHEHEKCNDRCLARHQTNGTEQLRMWARKRSLEEEKDRKKNRTSSSANSTAEMQQPETKPVDPTPSEKQRRHKDRYERSSEHQKLFKQDRSNRDVDAEERKRKEAQLNQQKQERSQRIPKRSKPLSSQTHTIPTPPSPSNSSTDSENCSSACVDSEQRCRSEAEASCIKERNTRLQAQVEEDPTYHPQGNGTDIADCINEKHAQCAAIGQKCSLHCRVGVTKRSLTRIEVAVPPPQDEPGYRTRRDRPTAAPQRRSRRTQPATPFRRPSEQMSSLSSSASSLDSSIASVSPLTYAVAETALDAKRKLNHMSRLDHTRLQRIAQGHEQCTSECVEAEQRCIDECNEDDPLIQIHPVRHASSPDTPSRLRTLGERWRDGSLVPGLKPISSPSSLALAPSPPRRNTTSRGYQASAHVRKELARQLGSDALRRCVGECDAVQSQCRNRCDVAHSVLVAEVQRIAGEKKQSLVGMTRRRIRQLESEDTKTPRSEQQASKIQRGLAFSLEDFLESDILASPEKKNEFRRRVSQQQPRVVSSDRPDSQSTRPAPFDRFRQRRPSKQHTFANPNSLNQSELIRALTKLIVEEEETVHFSIDGDIPLNLTDFLQSPEFQNASIQSEEELPSIPTRDDEHDAKQQEEEEGEEEKETEKEKENKEDEEEEGEEEREEDDDEKESQKSEDEEEQSPLPEESPDVSIEALPDNLKAFARAVERMEVKKKVLSDQCDIQGVHQFSLCIENGNACLEEGQEKEQCRELVESCLVAAVLQHDTCESDIEQEYAEALQLLQDKYSVTDQETEDIKRIVAERIQRNKEFKHRTPVKTAQSSKLKREKKENKAKEKAERKIKKITQKLQKTLEELQHSSGVSPVSPEGSLYPECDEERTECYNSCRRFEDRCIQRQTRNGVVEDDAVTNCRRVSVECGLECDSNYRQCVEGKMHSDNHTPQTGSIRDATPSHQTRRLDSLRAAPRSPRSPESAPSSPAPRPQTAPPAAPLGQQGESAPSPPPLSQADLSRWVGMSVDDCNSGAERCRTMCARDYPAVQECPDECATIHTECVTAVSSRMS